MELKHIGNFKVAAAVAEGFHHHHELGVGLDFGAVMVEVADQMVEIDFQHGFVCFFLQFHPDLLKLESTCSF